MPHRVALMKLYLSGAFGGGFTGWLVAFNFRPTSVLEAATMIGYALAGLGSAWVIKTAKPFADAMRIKAQGKAEAARIDAESRAETMRIEAQARADSATIEATAKIQAVQQWLNSNQGEVLKRLETLDTQNEGLRAIVEKNQTLLVEHSDEKRATEDVLHDLTDTLARQLGLLSKTVPMEVLLPTVKQPDRGSQTILIVEDDRDMRRVLYSYLRRARFNCLTANSLEQAMERLDYLPTAILLDLNLPDGVGETLIDHLAATRSPCRIVVLSGLGEADHVRLDAVRLRVAALIQKPLEHFDVVVQALDLDQKNSSKPQ